MRRLRSACIALLVGLGACDDGEFEPLPDDEYCTVVMVMDEVCPEWREEADARFSRGCSAGAWTIARDRHGPGEISNLSARLEPDPGDCLDE